jgi:hypothetical protein
MEERKTWILHCVQDDRIMKQNSPGHFYEKRGRAGEWKMKKSKRKNVHGREPMHAYAEGRRRERTGARSFI